MVSGCQHKLKVKNRRSEPIFLPHHAWFTPSLLDFGDSYKITFCLSNSQTGLLWNPLFWGEVLIISIDWIFESGIYALIYSCNFKSIFCEWLIFWKNMVRKRESWIHYQPLNIVTMALHSALKRVVYYSEWLIHLKAVRLEDTFYATYISSYIK